LNKKVSYIRQYTVIFFLFKIPIIVCKIGNVTTFAGLATEYEDDDDTKEYIAFVAGNADGFGTNAQFAAPSGISASPNGTYALIADTSNNRIRKIILSTAQVTTFAGSSSTGSSDGVGSNAKILKQFAFL
jgi:hypothetical protein